MIKKLVADEKQKMKDMSFNEKRQYIWEYYKLHILISLVLLYLIGSLINTFVINPPKDNFLYIAWTAGHITASQMEHIEDALSPLVPNPNREQISMSSYTLGTDPEMNMGLRMRMAALVTIAGIDLFILPFAEITDFLEQQQFFWLTVEDLLPYATEISETLANEMLSRGVHIPAAEGLTAMSLAGSTVLEEVGINTSDVYVAILGNAQNLEAVSAALEILFR